MAENKTKKRRGAPIKYTARKLEAAVMRYFDSISYEADVVDEHGKRIINLVGEPVKQIRYAIPPSKQDLCLYLHIDRGTWLNYSNHEKHPEMADITEYANLRCEAYLSYELVRREKGVDGIKFNLQNNYGWTNKKEVEVGEKTREVLSIDSMTLAEKMAAIRAAAGDIEENGFGDFDDGEGEAEDNG